MSHFCRQWRLKPSASKTISSVFYLHIPAPPTNCQFLRMASALGTSATHLSWGDTRLYAVLQRTLDKGCRQPEELKQLVDEASQRQYSADICSGTLLSSSRVLRPSLVTLCSHKSGQCVQLNSTMRLISGTLRSTPLTWLPVLSNIEPPALRRKAATVKLVEKIVKHDS